MVWMLVIGLWVIDILDHLTVVSVGGSVLSIFMSIALTVVLLVDGHEMKKTTIEKVKRLKRLSLILTFIFIPIAIITPNKSTLMVMCGVSIGSKALEEIGSHDEFMKIKKIIDLKLDKYIKDLERVDTGK